MWKYGKGALALVLSVSSICSAQATSNDTRNQVSGLANDDRATRLATLDELQKSRQAIISPLLSSLERLHLEKDRDFGCPLHVTIAALGAYRAEEAIPLLAGLLDFQLRRGSMPGGGFSANESYYPAADALARIGGKAVADAMIDRLGRAGVGDRTIGLCTWVLQKSVGPDAAIAMLQRLPASNAGVAGTAMALKLLNAEGGYPSPPLPGP
jgi:hypothetical protein